VRHILAFGTAWFRFAKNSGFSRKTELLGLRPATLAKSSECVVCDTGNLAGIGQAMAL
jgi:hypothetical protein